MQKELRLCRKLPRRRIGLKHGELLQQRLLLLQRRGERLDVLRRSQCPERAVHEQLLANQLSGQRCLRVTIVLLARCVLLLLLLMISRKLAADYGTRWRRAAAGTATTIPLRDIRDLK